MQRTLSLSHYMKKKLPLHLEELLEYFPPIQPPITLSEEIAYKFSTENKPLSEKIIAETFSKWEQMDEYVEFVPCCRLDLEEPYFALIYWKGGLMIYEYKLITLSETGELIDSKVIAGTVSNGVTVKSSVATIDTDNCIYTMVGETEGNRKFDPSESTAFKFELLPDGKIHTL